MWVREAQGHPLLKRDGKVTEAGYDVSRAWNSFSLWSSVRTGHMRGRHQMWMADVKMAAIHALQRSAQGQTRLLLTQRCAGTSVGSTATCPSCSNSWAGCMDSSVTNGTSLACRAPN